MSFSRLKLGVHIKANEGKEEEVKLKVYKYKIFF
jgi:hypothetical protein